MPYNDPRNIPVAEENPYSHFLAYLKIDRSLMPMCMAILANQAKNITCQKVNLPCPAKGTPVQILSLATAQKSENE